MILEAKTVFRGPQVEVSFRVAEHNGKIYFYLADPGRNVIEISPGSWRLLPAHEVPVKFRHSHGMEALPIPEHGGHIGELRPFFNVHSDDHFVLLVACALGAFREHGPFIVLVINGEQGAAKSSCTRYFRALIDPNQALVRAQPKDEKDFYVTAMHSHILAFDNISSLHNWFSDALCQMATGAGFAAGR